MTLPHRTFADFHDTGWRTGLFRALLIAVLAASAVAAPAAVLRLLMSWRMVYLLPLALSAALLGVFDTVRLGRPDWRDRRGLVFRLGEVLLLLVGHAQFKSLDPVRVAQLTTARLLLDTVNGWPAEAWRAAGFKVEKLGDRKNTSR